MTWMDHIASFSAVDGLAVAGLVLVWLVITRVIEHPPKSRPSTSVLMAGYRRDWMREMVTREPRIFDSQIIGNMRQGTAFFASASMISIGGGLALIGNAEQLTGVAEDLTLGPSPRIVWEIKLILLLVFAANAFLKFVWAHRLFGYAAVLMAAVPNDPEDPRAYPRAAKAAEINIFAARSYNRGLRSVYFGIAASAWLLGAVPLIVATCVTLTVIIRREFASQSRAALIEDGSHADVTATHTRS